MKPDGTTGTVVDIVSTLEDQEGRPLPGEEDTLTLDVGGIRADFFFTGGEELHRHCRERMGQKIVFTPTLSICTPRRTPQGERSFWNTPAPGAAWRARLTGPVTRVIRSGGLVSHLMVDCGFPILVENSDTHGPMGARARHDWKPGDWAEAEGRPEAEVHTE